MRRGLAYLYTPRSRLPEFSPGHRSCDCQRCRSHAWRDLCNRALGYRYRWHRMTTCRIHGHQFPATGDLVLTWKLWCRRCMTPMPGQTS